MATALSFSAPCILQRTTFFSTAHVARRGTRRPVVAFRVAQRPYRFACCIEASDWKRGPMDIDYERDEKLQILEEELDGALEREEFGRAAEVRDKLTRLQSGAYVAVLSANLKFYKAFEAGSVVDMAGVWLQDSSVTCKHPLGPLVTGYVNTINSFGYLFALGVPRVEVRNIRIMMRGSAAWVTCEEHSHSLEGEGSENELYDTHRDSGPVPIRLDATNIFVKRNSQWYLAHHSVQPIYKTQYQV